MRRPAVSFHPFPLAARSAVHHKERTLVEGDERMAQLLEQTAAEGSMRDAGQVAAASAALSRRAEVVRIAAGRALDPETRARLGQFFTPEPVAALMASMLDCRQPEVHILDAGAGAGSLFAALVALLCGRGKPPRRITVTAYEVDERLMPYLRQTLQACADACARAGIAFESRGIHADFLESAVTMLRGNLFASTQRPFPFNCVILNPPYRKIHSASAHRTLLRRIGVETSNLYTGFLAAAIHLLEPGGEMVAITPRSFCNGPYFRPFRRSLLEMMSLRRLHIFDSREEAFGDDAVLQENVILSAVRGAERPERVTITASHGIADDLMSERDVPYAEVVRPDDPRSFIHIVADDMGRAVRERINTLGATLADLGLSVSTGRVVDFRARPYLRQQPEAGAPPLIYPAHFDHGYIVWPRPAGKKPNALAIDDYTRPQLVPNGHYVLVRRFSAKEERRRVVAAIYDAGRVPCEAVGFENHLNYFHRNGNGLGLTLARGLAAYLNSTLVDAHFRQFNGHTQVNATDLRSLTYPALDQLERLGARIGDAMPDQAELDALLREDVFGMADDHQIDPVLAEQRVDEARAILSALGFPKRQQNERSALTLLALLDLSPTTPWAQAGNPLRGITPMMDFFRQHYGKHYAPNTRETMRRQTVHQFVDAALAVVNPDDPMRPTNSGQTVYQIEGRALELVRTFGTPAWDTRLTAYLAQVGSLRERYARARNLARVPVRVFVSAFPDRQTMAKHLAEIDWDTEVWTADAPEHLIHFNGEKFLSSATEPTTEE